MADKRPESSTRDGGAKAKAIERWEDEGGPVAPAEQSKKKRLHDLNQRAKRMAAALPKTLQLFR